MASRRPVSLSEGSSLERHLPRLQLQAIGSSGGLALLLPDGTLSPTAIDGTLSPTGGGGAASPPADGTTKERPVPLLFRCLRCRNAALLPPADGAPPVLSCAAQCAAWGDWLILTTLRFAVHLSLLSIFESIFFWLFVSSSEDAALIKLVDSYVDGALSNCSAWTNGTRSFVNFFASILLNRSLIDADGNAARVLRQSHNSVLVTLSWTYVGVIIGLTLLLGVVAGVRKLKVDVAHLAAENIALVVFLGLYEFLFFKTIIFKYEAISPSELDARVVDSFNADCGIL